MWAGFGLWALGFWGWGSGFGRGVDRKRSQGAQGGGRKAPAHAASSRSQPPLAAPHPLWRPLNGCGMRHDTCAQIRGGGTRGGARVLRGRHACTCTCYLHLDACRKAGACAARSRSPTPGDCLPPRALHPKPQTPCSQSHPRDSTPPRLTFLDSSSPFWYWNILNAARLTAMIMPTALMMMMPSVFSSTLPSAWGRRDTRERGPQGNARGTGEEGQAGHTPAASLPNRRTRRRPVPRSRPAHLECRVLLSAGGSADEAQQALAHALGWGGFGPCACVMGGMGGGARPPPRTR